jgi:hypothetical protein
MSDETTTALSAAGFQAQAAKTLAAETEAFAAIRKRFGPLAAHAGYVKIGHYDPGWDGFGNKESIYMVDANDRVTAIRVFEGFGFRRR